MNIAHLPRAPGIYRITHTPTGRDYIGSARRVRSRMRRHRLELRVGKHTNEHLQRAWAKYGEAQFECALVESVEHVADLLTREQFHIDARNPAFNLCRKAGSSLGIKRRPETVEKIRRANTGRKATAEAKANLSAAWKTRPPMSEESRRKLSASLKAHYSLPEARAKLSERGRGKKRSSEFCTRMSVARKAFLQAHPEERQAMSQWAKARMASPEARKRLSKQMTGKKHSVETRAKLSAIQRGTTWTQAEREAHRRGYEARRDRNQLMMPL